MKQSGLTPISPHPFVAPPPLLLISWPVIALPSTSPHLCSSLISPPAHLPRDIHALSNMLHTINVLAEQADMDLTKPCTRLQT